MSASMARGLRRSAFLRSHLLQAGWNDEGMQNLGFAYCVQPFVRGGPGGLRRHLGYFNTQPHMSGFVIGAVGALERAGADARRIETVKRSMGSALAGVGDALFWGALRPACAALALLSGLCLERPQGASFKGTWLAAAALFILAFNIPGIFLRWRGVLLGAELGEGVVAELKRIDWQSWISRIRWTGLALTGGIIAVMVHDGRGAGAYPLALGGAGLLGGLGLKAAGATPPQAYAALLAFGLLLGGFR